jgi:diguanylate cyclase (GGDEF)-like protein/PAS domain S-box-containing protein
MTEQFTDSPSGQLDLPVPPQSSQEAERLEALRRLAILDTASDPAFDRLTQLAATFFNAPISFVSFIDEHRQWMKSSYGSEITETPRNLAFCAYTILQHDLTVVPDATEDPRFAGHPAVTGNLGVRFYAAAPIVTSQGQNVGSLCVLDTKPRPPLTLDEQTVLRSLADLAREAAEKHQASFERQRKDTIARSRYALVARATLDGVWDWDIRKNKVFYSHRWQHILGLPEREFSAGLSHWLHRVHPEDEPRVQDELQQHIDGKTPRFRSEHRLRHSDGSSRWVVVCGLVQRTRAGRPVRMTGSLMDVTAHKTCDELTGLPNRFHLHERLTQLIIRSEAEQRWSFAVLSLDVDRFHRINDRFGHTAGDAMLKGIGHRLSEIVAQTRNNSQSMVARIAEDEFVIVLDGVQNSDQAQVVAQRIHAILATPMDCEGESLTAGVSIGIAMAAPERRDPESFLQKSDLAMVRAKTAGRNLSAVYDPAMQEQTLARMELEQELRQAVAFSQLRVEYQPQINLHTGALVGCEALVRWQHPRRGLLMPADFIGVAEEIGIISSIDLWVLEQACAQLAEWHQIPCAHDLKMSVNFSAQHLPKRGLKEGVQRLIRAHNLPAQALCLELTESVLDGDVEARVGLMEELCSVGVGLHMDDFGSGYSSFKQLYELPFDTLKIDRSFMEKVLEETKARNIVEGILGLSRLINLKVVAEGVEEPLQAELLKQMGCHIGQGFLYDRPLDALTFCRHYLQTSAKEQCSVLDTDTSFAHADREVA